LKLRAEVFADRSFLHVGWEEDVEGVKKEIRKHMPRWLVVGKKEYSIYPAFNVSLEGKSLGEILPPSPVPVFPPSESVDKVIKVLEEKETNYAVVVKRNKVVGVLSLEEIELVRTRGKEAVVKKPKVGVVKLDKDLRIVYMNEFAQSFSPVPQPKTAREALDSALYPRAREFLETIEKSGRAVLHFAHLKPGVWVDVIGTKEKDGYLFIIVDRSKDYKKERARDILFQIISIFRFFSFLEEKEMPDVEKTLKKIVSKIKDVLGVNVAVLYLGGTGEKMHFVVSRGMGKEKFLKEVGEEEVENVISSRHTGSSYAKGKYYLHLPLLIENELIGVLSLGKKTPFNPEDTGFILSLLPYLSLLFYHLMLLRKEQRFGKDLDRLVKEKTYHLEVLYNITREIGYTLHYRDLAGFLLGSLRLLFNYEVAACILDMEGKIEVMVKHNTRIPLSAQKDFISLLKKAVKEGMGKDVTEEELSMGFSPEFVSDIRKKVPIRSFFYLPIATEKKLIGIVAVGSTYPHAFSEREILTLRTIISHAAYSIEKLHGIIERERRKLASILEHLEDAIFHVSTDGDFLFMNSKGREVLKEIPREKILSYAENVFHTGTSVDREIELENGKTYKILGYPIPEEESAIVVLRDITEEVAMKKELLKAEKLSTLASMAASVTHELNNPLTTIMGMSEYLLQEELPPHLRDILEKIYEAAKRSKKIVTNLLQFAYPKSTELSSVDLNDIVNAVYELRRYEFKNNNVALIPETHSQPVRVKGDAIQLEQLLINLVNNAMEAIVMDGRSSGKVWIRTYPEKNCGILEVEDNGPGIPRSIMDRIFDPFFTTKPVGKGTGLGLSIVYKIVKDHNGKIKVHSIPGKGTKFTVSIPLMREEVKEKKGRMEDVALSGRKILVIDDEEGIRMTLKMILEKLGCQVSTAGDVGEGMLLLDKDKYDLILCDIKMPGISGIEFYDIILQRYPEYTRKIVFLTGDVVSAETKKFLERTRRPTLKKPFSIQELKEFIKRGMK